MEQRLCLSTVSPIRQKSDGIGIADWLASSVPATSSVEVVQGQPGFLGHLVAGPASEHQHEFIFASIWANVDAVKARFGEQWRVSLLPPGYAELIEACSVDHYHLTAQSLDRR